LFWILAKIEALVLSEAPESRREKKRTGERIL